LLFIYVLGLGLWALPLYFLVKPNGSLILIVLVFSGFAYERATYQGEFKLTVLPLDSGLALFAKPHDECALLIDCGSESGARFSVVPFLRSQGYNEAPMALVRHGERHHVQDFGKLADEMGMTTLILNPTKFNSSYHKALVEAAAESDAGTVLAA